MITSCLAMEADIAPIHPLVELRSQQHVATCNEPPAIPVSMTEPTTANIVTHDVTQPPPPRMPQSASNMT